MKSWMPQDQWIIRHSSKFIRAFQIFFVLQILAIVSGCIYTATSGTMTAPKMVHTKKKTTTDPKNGSVIEEEDKTEVTGPSYSGAGAKDMKMLENWIETPDFVVHFGGVTFTAYDPKGILAGIATMKTAYYIGAGFILLGILIGWLSGKWLLGVIIAAGGFSIIGAAHFCSEYPWAPGVCAALLLLSLGIGIYELYKANKQGKALTTVIKAVESSSATVQEEVKDLVKDKAGSAYQSVKSTISAIKDKI